MSTLLVIDKEQAVSKGKGHKPPNFINCPRCGSATYYYGFHPSGFQKYQCKSPRCKYQFVPELPQKTKKPRIPCPNCGSAMYPYKHIPDGLRFRCAKYRKKSKDRCTHKVNLPFPGEKAFKVSTDPIDDLDNQLVERFFWNKMAYSKDTVTLALFFAEVVGLPANTTSFILSYLFQVGASHDTITRWRKKAALAWHKKLGALKLPSTSTLHFDETGFKEKGRKVWLWLGYEESFCSLQGWHFSHRRATQFARNTLARVKVPPEKLSESKIVTDGLYSYQSALGDLPCFSSAYHHIFSDFREEINNNVLERKYGSLKDLARRFRGFKSRLGLWSFVTGQVYLDTYFWPKEKLAGLAPAERTGLKLPEFKQRWKWLCRYLT